MIERSEGPERQPTTEGPAKVGDALPFVVELWSLDHRSIERVLACAASQSLARAIFKSAHGENPDRRITLRHDTQILADSAN